MKAEIYTISNDYISYLRSIDTRVLINEEPGKNVRKYIGIILTINSFNYFVPLSSPKPSDYFTDKKGRTLLRGSVTPIYRITEKSGNTRNFLGKLKFSNMIPVPDSEMTLLDLSKLKKDYVNMVNNQLRHIRKNFDNIVENHALKIYNEKASKTCTEKYLQSTLNFKDLEQALNNYKKTNIPITEVALEKEIETSAEIGQPTL